MVARVYNTLKEQSESPWMGYNKVVRLIRTRRRIRQLFELSPIVGMLGLTVEDVRGDDNLTIIFKKR